MERWVGASPGRREWEAVVRGGGEKEDANGQMWRVGGCKGFGEGEDIARYWFPKHGMMVWGVRFPNPAGRGKLATETPVSCERGSGGSSRFVKASRDCIVNAAARFPSIRMT
jgi:hypothetical protein